MDYKASEFLVPIFDFNLLHLQLNTPLFIFVLLLIVMFAMNRLLFKPVLRTLDNRAAQSERLAEAIEIDRKEIESLAQSYEENLARIRVEVAQVRAEARKQAQDAVNAILDQARKDAGRSLQTALAELEAEVEQARQVLAGSARELAQQTTNRILGA